MTHPFLLLDIKQHRLHGWKRESDFGFARASAWAPLLIAEVPRALAVFPIAFARRSAGGYQLAALLGMHKGHNLFVDGAGKWLADYIPSHYRAYPFSMIETPQGDKRVYGLGFFQASGLYRESPNSELGEERFFDDEGKLQPFMEKLFEFLKATTVNCRQTQTAVDALAQAGVLIPWNLAAAGEQLADQPPLQGFYRIDEHALAALPGDVLHELNRSSALLLAYGQLLSMPRINLLRTLLKLKQPAPPPTGLDLEKLFDKKDDIFKFGEI